MRSISSVNLPECSMMARLMPPRPAQSKHGADFKQLEVQAKEKMQAARLAAEAVKIETDDSSKGTG